MAKRGKTGGRSKGADGVEKMLKKLTLEQKCAQLCSIYPAEVMEGRRFSPEKAANVLANGIGEISRAGGDSDLEPWEVAELTRSIQGCLSKRAPLGIRAIVHEECLSGYMARRATVFPQAIGMASTWNPDLVREITESIRRLMRAVGVHQGLAPLLDVCREPRWGRIEETFGEDPYLVAAMGCAYIRGLQGDELKKGVIATGKHFVAYGIPDGGRNLGGIRIGPRELRDVYLYTFEAAVKTAGLGSIMNAYHEVDGVPSASSKEFMTDVLRGEWGFDGIVVSDYGAIEMLRTRHGCAADRKAAAKLSLEAGCDVELSETECYGAPLVEAVRNGLVAEKYVDRAVRRVLAMKARLGLLDAPRPAARKVTLSMFDSAANRARSRRAAVESIVLLKNDNNILPLGKDVGAIAVIGPNADSTTAMLGDYTHYVTMTYWRKAPKDYHSLKVVKVLEGIRSAAPAGCAVDYARGCDIADGSREHFPQAVELAARSDIAIAVMGEHSLVYSGEGKDRDDLGLLGVQADLVRELAATGVPVVLVLLTGRPLALKGVDDYCAAVLEAWYPGEEGGNAIADIIFGKANPSGRLPASFPETTGQVPVHYSRRPFDFRGYVPDGDKRSLARYPFGHGLSYTSFELTDLAISPDSVKAGGTVKVSASLKNTGERAGSGVVQLYIGHRATGIVRPLKELKGFQKAFLKPGAKATVEFALDTRLLAFTNVDMNLVIERGRYDVMVGFSSEDIRLKDSFEIKGATKRIAKREVFFTPARVTLRR
ncbi:MAG: glycoside hydrolase family 3 N-terminal domain-containing protein [Planctomycetota bacterium]|jgi:beta-glucosidase